MGKPFLNHSFISPTRSCVLDKGYLCSMDCTDKLLLTSHSSHLYLWGELDGSLPTPMKTLQGHVMDVTIGKFFPSGLVVLSGGMDMTLKIWSLEHDGLCVAQLLGHKRAVTGCDFVDQGRNVVTSSKDGRTCLWDIPTQRIIFSWESPQKVAINDCSLLHSTNFSNYDLPVLDDRDRNTSGYVLLTAGAGGYVGAFDLRSREKVFQTLTNTKSDQNAIVGLKNTNYVVSGGDDGHVFCWDLRKFGEGKYVYSTRIGINRVTRLLQAVDESCWIGSSMGFFFGVFEFFFLNSR
eukprot:TRINITY_DN3705_c0_g1_i34.p1 TRINITY_DN3705_c0_g1~~TRINITY_DN3705_c0_g1_i34.p1  ORF type:complete len:292 (-),score=53.94 TRINITY_DN3705_c0_g1_i34:674-1549(-)